ncbi:hypothetical protein OROGR_027407 [Orobanche gracilis]
MDGGGSSSEKQSSLPTIEKGRNKRKCSSDLTVNHPVELSPVSLTGFPPYEMLEQQLRNTYKQFGSMVEKSKDANKGQEVREHELDAEWDDPITCHLEELLSNILSTNFSDAVKKLVASGYTEEVAEWAVLSSSTFNGNKDVVSNIINGALALLKLDEHVEMPKNSVFDGLLSLVEYTLLEMTHIVREVRPGLTVTEAMWCLLLSDLNLASACGHQDGPEVYGESPTLSETKLEASGTGQSDFNRSVSLKPGDPRAQIFRPETTVPGSAQTKKDIPLEFGKESYISIQELKVRFSGIHMDEKSGDGGSKKGPSIIFKRDLLRQKAIHFEKNYKGRLTKGAFKAKVATWGSMVLDKSLKSQSGLSSVVIKDNDSKLTISTVGNEKLPINSQSSIKDLVFELPVADSGPCSKTETDVSIPYTKTETNVSNPLTHPTDYYDKIPFDEIIQKYVPRDDKDKTLLILVPLKAGLEKELQGWTDWANEKVMQAARKLGKDQTELKTLRQEKEELENSKEEKQTMDEGTIKRLTEMERALSNATGQIELANCTVKRLECENDVLKRESEDAKMEARGSRVKLEEAMVNENGIIKKMQSWEMERGLLMEKLINLKREIAGFENRLVKAKNRQNQFKLLLKQEEKETLKAGKRFDSLRGKRAEEDALMKVEADNIKQMAQTEKQKFEDDIKNLQTMITKMKLESDKKKIAALNLGYGPNITGKQKLPKTPKRLAVFQDIVRSDDVQPERECVMCLTEEKSVVFIPCAHQVLCGSCNVLHEKQGMTDCPSCRSTIDTRVSVTFRAG